LNDDLDQVPDEFRDLVSTSGIRFCLASRSPGGIETSGIIRRRTSIQYIGINDSLFSLSLNGSSAWDTDRYLNIWVANTGDNITGYGSYPNQVPPERQGVVVHPRYFGTSTSESFGNGRVAVHEIGHFLGLRHTWDNNVLCNMDDGVADTPIQSVYYLGCPEYPQSSCGTSDMFMNFMDYVDDRCMNFFTKGQMSRMIAVLDEFRHDLSENPRCVGTFTGTSEVAFDVFPTISEGNFTIGLSSQDEKWGYVQIYNSIGMLVFREFMFVHDKKQIATRIESPGAYFVRVGNTTRAIIVK
jgi:hypothetical protein